MRWKLLVAVRLLLKEQNKSQHNAMKMTDLYMPGSEEKRPFTAVVWQSLGISVANVLICDACE